jgi:hypothetical protein
VEKKVGLLLLLTLLVAGCQGGGAAEPAATSAPATTAVEEPATTPVPATETAVSPTATAVPPTATTESETMSESDQANADVTFVRAVETEDAVWTFHVTVEHPDTGWEDYADGWDVVLPDGTVVKPESDSPFTRLLLHPHENEQPFTRSQSGIVIPDNVTEVRVRAHDMVDGFGGREVVVELTCDSGRDFEVEPQDE